MIINISGNTFPIEHKTMMGSLTDIWRIGNAFRTKKGLSELDLGHFLRSPETLEFVSALENSIGVKCADSAHLKSDGRVPTIKSELIRTKRGKGGGTWAHLYILLDAAARLDPEFRLEMYKTFVESKILQWRDDSGDQFIHLNYAIDAHLPGREGKDNTPIYIQVAVMLKKLISPDGGSWNTASYIQLEKRARFERSLVDYLKMGFIRDWEHLKQTISSLT